MKRSTTVGLITATALLVTLQAHHAGTAGAQAGGQVVADTLPTEVAVSHRMIEVTSTVKVAPNAHGIRSATLWFSYSFPAPAKDPRTGTPWGEPAKNPANKKPVAGPSPSPALTADKVMPIEVGSATSHRSGLLTVTARIDAGRIVPGRNLLDVIDGSDGAHRTIVLDLRRQSRVAISGVTFGRAGQATVSMRVRHFDPKLEKFRPSHFSPMRVQEQIAGAWVTLATVTSNTAGVASAVVAAGPGVHYYRVLRPGGATVTAATSKTVLAGRRVPAIGAS